MTPAQAALLAVLAAPEGAPLPPLPPTLVVTAHPDDETVGAGSRLPRLAQAQFACVTDGAPRDGEDAARLALTPADYARERRLELQTVLVRCGIPPGHLRILECADQQAALQLAPLARRLADLFAEHGIAAVLTHAYEGGHPDHDATAFAVHAAAALLRARGAAEPGIVEMASYHRGPEGLRTCSFLPAPDGQQPAVTTLHLTARERERKADLVASYATQQGTLRNFPLDCEAFRPAPRYDFGRPPHPGTLNYELHPWGMTGEGFRKLASEALTELGLREAARPA